MYFTNLTPEFVGLVTNIEAFYWCEPWCLVSSIVINMEVWYLSLSLTFQENIVQYL